jgi:hypothetical protein
MTKSKDEKMFLVAVLPRSAGGDVQDWVAGDVRDQIKKIEFRSPLELVMVWAEQGDWGCLAEYIEASRMGTKEMRTFLAAVLRQEIKKPRYRAPVFKRIFGPAGVREKVQFFLSLLKQGVGREAAVDETAEKFSVDRRTIQRDLKEGEGAVRFLDELVALASQVDEPRYVVSNTALTPHFMS